eukprot:scaffold44227_cov47-Phaeocystis_antarctica.AAC.1
MSGLFKGKSAFNADISNWNTSSVTTMYEMFRGASAFNQPLSFDTSSVTTMTAMFSVRSSPCPATNLQSRPPLDAACAAVVHRLLPPDPCTSPRTACPSFDSRQYALAFNQSLSFDTSSVTATNAMFSVRSSPRVPRMPCTQSAVTPSPGRCVRRGRPPPAAPRPVYLAPHRMPFFRLSAVRVGVQPAAEL